MRLSVIILFVASLLLSSGCLGEPSKTQSGEQIARNWLVSNAPTFQYGGGENSIALQSTQALPSGCTEYVYSFATTGKGYGSKPERAYSSFLSFYNTTIHVCNGNVTWANTDGVYDEIHKTDICMMLSAIIEVCGEDNQTYQHPCFAKAKGVAIAYNGACVRPPRGTEGGFCGGIAGFQCNDGLTCVLDGTYPDAGGKCVKEGGAQSANPASVYCVKSGGALEIRKDAQGGEVGYCTLANSTVCEEWALFRGECGIVSDACKTKSDCGYAWFTGACHTPAWVQHRQEMAANQGLLLGESPPRENVTCTCEKNVCVTHG